MGYLNPLDSSFLQMESERTPMHVAGLMVFHLPDDAGPTYLGDLFEAIRTSDVNLYPFNCKLKEGSVLGLGASWEQDEDIDIDYHVRHSALPYPGGEKELGVLVARLHSHPIDLSRPPWEFHLIEGLENNRFALYSKTHHSAIDGMGAMGMITRWLSEDSKAENGYAPWATTSGYKEKASKKGPGKNALTRAIEAAREQLNATAELSKAVYHMSKPSENPEGGISSAMNTPKTRFNVKITPQRRVATQLYDVARFKALSKATGATINDVALSVIGAATRRYLMELDALPENPLVASIPIALPRPDGKPGNAVAGFVCPLETDKADLEERVRTINAVTSRTKNQLQGMSLKALNQFSYMGVAPLMLSQMSGVGKMIPPLFNLVVSNVVAPQKKLYLKGAELEVLYPISLLFDGYALNVTIVGYSDKVAMGFVGCRAATPSLQRLAVYTGEALAELEQRVLNKN